MKWIGSAIMALWMLAGCGREGPPAPAASAPAGGAALAAGTGVPAEEGIADKTVVPVSKRVDLDTSRAFVPGGVPMTLPVDLPPGTKAETLRVMIGWGRRMERLDVPVTVSADGKSASFRLTRMWPLVAPQPATAPAPGGVPAAAAPQVVLVRPTGNLVVVEDTDQLRISVIQADMARITPEIWGSARDALVRSREWFTGLGYTVPPKVELEIKPVDGAWAYASGGKLIEVDSRTTTRKEDFDFIGPVHEYFHMIQQHAANTNLATSRLEGYPRNESWIAEGTADLMGGRRIPARLYQVAGKPQIDFGYKPLDHYDRDLANNPHQYQTYVFFQWLSEHYDIDKVLQEFFRLYLSDKIQRANVDDEIGSPAAVDSRYVLDHVLRNMADRDGKKRSLRRAYIEMLLSLYVEKDMPPMAAVQGAVFGPAKELRTPPALTSGVEVPLSQGGTRELAATTGTFGGGGLAIMQAVKIVQKTQQGETGSLKVKTEYARRPADPKHLLTMVFPVSGGKVGAHKSAGAGETVEIGGWEKLEGAIVWVVNTSLEPINDVKVTAALDMKPTPTIALYEAPLGPMLDASKTLATDSRAPVIIAFFPAESDAYTKNYGRLNGRGAELLRDDGTPPAIKVTSRGNVKYVVYRRALTMRGETSYVLPEFTADGGAGEVEYALEAVDKTGATATTTLKVKYTGAPRAGTTAEQLLKSIAAEKGLAKPDKTRLLSFESSLATAYATEGNIAKAWDQINACKTAYADVLKDTQHLYYLYDRLKVAEIAGNGAEYVATCEAIAAINTMSRTPDKMLVPRQRAEWLEKAARGHLLYFADYRKAKEAFTRANAIAGTPEREWEFWPLMKAVK